MKIIIDNQEIEVVIVYKKIKNVYFRFKDDLKLYVSCHPNINDYQIKEMINKNAQGILNMYENAKKKQIRKKNFVILDETYLVIIDDLVKKPFISNNYIIGSSESDIEKFYIKEAKRFIGVRFERCYNLFNNLPKVKLRYRKMTSRWGVCNTKLKIITINTELYKYSVSLIDYVIIHELCHLIEPNHSPRFWQEVSKYYPNYKQARKLLKDGV